MMVEPDETHVVCDTCQVLMIRLDGLLACVELNSVERTHSLVAMR